MKFFVPLLALVASAAALPATDDGAVRPVRSVDRGEEDPPKPVRAEDLKFHLGDRTVCGTEDNLENIICYQNDPDEPEVYTRGKAVLRVYNRVAGTLGTGWLVGDEGHILTNWHVIETQAEAEGAEFQAMAESSTCQPKCEIQLGCGGYKINNDPVTFIKTGGSIAHDYTLMKLSAADAAAVQNLGFLQIRSTGAVLDERIYIPNHSQGWGKMIDMSVNGKFITATMVTTTQVGYDHDTYGGASGSPVLGHSDDAVIAIHNLGGCYSSGGSNKGVSALQILSGLQGLLPDSAIYSGTTPTTPSPGDQVCKTINTVTKRWGYEISWTVGSCYSNQQYADQSQYSQNCCQAEGDWPVTCSDSYGDGWHGGYIEIDGERFCEDFTTGSSKDGGTASFSDEPPVCLDVKTVTKAWGYENSWHVGNCNSEQQYSSNSEYTQQCCLRSEDLELTCDCSYGDGWHGGYLEINGQRFCETFTDGYTTSETVSWVAAP